IFSRLAGPSTGRHCTEAVRPGWPNESAPAVSPPIADSRPITSLRAIPRSCPRVRSCSLSGSKFAAQGKKTSEEMPGDLDGIVIEIGNAPRNSIQLGSYVSPGPLLSTSIVPTSRCSKYTRRLVIRLLYLFGKIGQFWRKVPAIGSENVDRLEAQRFSNQETS